MASIGRPREPIDLLIAKGKKHLTKDEIDRRRKEELKVPSDNITAPSFLTKRQRESFDEIAEQLIALGIMTNLDIDALAAYVIERDGWIDAVKQLRKTDVRKDPALIRVWKSAESQYRQQMRVAASDLGLTITSRGKITVPMKEEPVPHDNKFAAFSKDGAV